MGNFLCRNVERRAMEQAPRSSPSPYTSTRIQSMLESRSKFTDKTSFEIECSKVHWSELDPASNSGVEYSPESDRVYFDEVLKKHPEWRRVFKDYNGLELFDKIAQGGQGEIYFARNLGSRYVVKVFGKGYPLRKLLQKMPPSVLSAVNYDSIGGPLENIKGATMLKDAKFKNRFAIVLEPQICDLRKLIDDQMMRKNNKGPPFTLGLVTKFMHKIAIDMVSLHYKYGIIHKDLKAANVLVPVNPMYILYEDVRFGSDCLNVADFECSMGVVGTRFWRAPEILRQLKDRKRTSPMEFTMASDVYSFGMVGYELVTGRIPFEDHPPSDYDPVLNGERPELPEDIHSSIGAIITDCWHPVPSMRPNFRELERKLGRLLVNRENEEWVNAKYEDYTTYCKLNNVEWDLQYYATLPTRAS